MILGHAWLTVTTRMQSVGTSDTIWQFSNCLSLDPITNYPRRQPNWLPELTELRLGSNSSSLRQPHPISPTSGLQPLISQILSLFDKDFIGKITKKSQSCSFQSTMSPSSPTTSLFGTHLHPHRSTLLLAMVFSPSTNLPQSVSSHKIMTCLLLRPVSSSTEFENLHF